MEDVLFLCLYAVEDGDGAVGRAVVVAPHEGFIVGVGSDDGYLLAILGEREHSVLVVEKDDALASHVEGYLAVFLAVHG